MDDTIGLSGAEAAFEDYLRGADGKRMISVNSDGKITGEYYSVEPRSGYTVELTVDLKLQQAVEDTLAVKVAQLNQKDHLDSRGAAAAVVKVGTGEILALASCPSYDLSTWRKDFAELSADDPAKPLTQPRHQQHLRPRLYLEARYRCGGAGIRCHHHNRRPFLTPATGCIPVPLGKINTNCWKRSGHGKMNVTSAITNSCNYLFHGNGLPHGTGHTERILFRSGPRRAHRH